MSFLTNLWEKVMAKLGPVASYIPALAQLIKVKLAEGDTAAIQAHAGELKEAAEALGALADAILLAVEDGTITVAEGSDIALAVEAAVDQFEDVFKGEDEDDLPV